MLLYILSVVFFFFAFLNSGKSGFISKLIWIATIGVGAFDLYLIFNGTVSDSVLINLLLSAIPIVMMLLAVVFLSISDEKKGADNSSQNEAKDHTTEAIPQNNNEVYANPCENSVPKTEHRAIEAPQTEAKEEKIFFKDQRLENFGTCDVEEIGSMLKITMRYEGNTYEFFAKGGNIETYRTDKMQAPASY